MDRKPRVVIMRGPSGSGKSTFVANLGDNYTVVSRDKIRPMFNKGSTEKTLLTPEQEKVVTEVEVDLLHDALRRGENVVIDDTNLNNQRARRWADEAHIAGCEFEEVNLYDPDKDYLYVERSDIPQYVVERQCKAAKKMGPIVARVPLMEPVVQDAKGHAVFVVDLDGTLARHNRSPHDYESLHTDSVIHPVAALVDFVGEDQVIFVSGRPDTYRKQTEEWLARNYIWGSGLYMRKEGDMRHDAVVKSEILDTLIKNGYYVMGAIDDRQRVLNMWRARGIFTFDVSQGGGKF